MCKAFETVEQCIVHNIASVGYARRHTLLMNSHDIKFTYLANVLSYIIFFYYFVFTKCL